MHRGVASGNQKVHNHVTQEGVAGVQRLAGAVVGRHEHRQQVGAAFDILNVFLIRNTYTHTRIHTYKYPHTQTHTGTPAVVKENKAGIRSPRTKRAKEV